MSITIHGSRLMLSIDLDEMRCNGCGLCADFCPVSVFEMADVHGRSLPVPVHLQECWACDTCVGQCPTGALRIVQPLSQVNTGREARTQLSPAEQKQYAEWSECLQRVLRLRWAPVAISLIPSE